MIVIESENTSIHLYVWIFCLIFMKILKTDKIACWLLQTEQEECKLPYSIVNLLASFCSWVHLLISPTTYTRKEVKKNMRYLLLTNSNSLNLSKNNLSMNQSHHSCMEFYNTSVVSFAFSCPFLHKENWKRQLYV